MTSNITRPRVVGGAVLHLAALGVLGPVVFSAVGGILATGFGGLAFVGIGIVLLVGLVYALYGIGWVEAARVEGLYRFGIPAWPLRSSGRPGFGGWLRSLGQQVIDPWMWRAIANLAVSTLLGIATLFFLSVLGGGIGLLFAWIRTADVRVPEIGVVVESGWAALIGVGFIAVGAAAIFGAALLHGVVSRALLVPSRAAQLAEDARVSREQRAGAVRAADVERSRIERDLHDGVQPRLVSMGMTLGLAQQKIDTDPAAAKALVAEAHTSTKAAITELRQLARGIHAAVLDDRGLDAALSALAARSVVPVRLDVRLDARCARDTEAAAYFAIAEALTNAAKHARASEVRVTVRLRDGATLWARVEDDGIGGAEVQPGGGLDGIVNRVVAAGGTATIDSPVGGPTAVEVSIPCAS